jgi:hypothetical protein
MCINYKKLIFVIGLCFTSVSYASTITFGFTGRLTVLDSVGGIIAGGGSGSPDPYGLQAPIHSTFTYDTQTGFGSGDLIISPLTYFGLDTQFHSMSMERIEGTNYVLGNMLVDFGVTSGIPVSLVWDATGLLNAIDYGLQAGDVISGTNLKRIGSPDFDVNSAIPASDGFVYGDYVIDQGAAPLATTSLNTSALCIPSYEGSGECLGVAVSGSGPFFDDGIAGSPLIDGPFTNLQVSIDIGSGNSLTVLSVSNVPVPAAVWLFGSGLICLIGVARRKKTY